MMETNNLGLQTELKPLQSNEFGTMLDNLGTGVWEMREGLASIGMTTLACGPKACNLTNLDSSMPDLCILDLLDWIDELAQDRAANQNSSKSRARQLASMVEMIMRRVEPIATAPNGRYELPFLLRGMAHPRVQVALEEMHTALNKIATCEIKAAQKIAA